MARRDRARRPPRRAAHREPRRRLLVVCEGECTEPQYVNGYARWVRNAAVEVQIARERGDPKKVVQIAKAEKAAAAAEARRQGDPWLDFDEVWCVFDRDDHERFHDAIQMASANSFELAVSNPCVELWLLLHFRDSPGARHRDELRRMLRDDCLPGYAKRLDFDTLAPGVAAATERARRLARDAAALGDDPFKNPTTGFYRLTDSIARTPEGA